jgi:hypothetical protein
MKRDYQSTKSSTSKSESDSHSDSDSESEILTPEILCEVGRGALSLEYDVTMVVHISDLGVHPNVLPSVSVSVRVATTDTDGSKMYYRYRR